MPPPSLKLRNIGPIRDGHLTFGDLTVLVGPQASGKSIALQWLKLVQDTGQIQAQLMQHGWDWGKDAGKFLDLYFGEGMRSVWNSGTSEIKWQGKTWDPLKKFARMSRDKSDSVFLIPAQRVLTLRDGWPRTFTEFALGDPFAVRSFSEKLRLLMEQEIGGGLVFPKQNRLKREYRDLLDETVFKRFRLSVDASQIRKRLMLGPESGGESLPFMVWSAGQREFVPLLLGLYWLMPPAKVARRAEIKWVIIEEPEMGMHPRAITVLLLLVLELLARGYRVCISTHSPQVLDLVWVLQALAQARRHPHDLLRVLEAPKTQSLRNVAVRALRKKCRVYYFETEGGGVIDITGLDPAAINESEATWGGLLEFSGRANEAVATAMANAREPGER